MSNVINNSFRTTPIPRTGRMLDAVVGGNASLSQPNNSSQPQYWELISTDEEGNRLSAPYIRTNYPISIQSEVGYIELGKMRWHEDVDAKSWYSTYFDNTEGNIYATGGLSALGHSDTEPTPGGGLDDVTITGSGNALTNMQYVNNILTGIKGETFATYAQFNSHATNSTIHISSSERSNWNSAYSSSHGHNNKSYLDNINQNLSTSSSPTFGSYIQIGSVRLVYNSSINGLYVQTSTGGAANLVSRGGLSALGYSGTEPGGSDGNNYLTGVSGSGNGTVTFTRQGLSALTWNAAHTHTWAQVTSKPTGLVTAVSISGSGNAVINASFSSGTLSLTKGNISGGSSWNGGTITNGIVASNVMRAFVSTWDGYYANWNHGGNALTLSITNTNTTDWSKGFSFYMNGTATANGGSWVSNSDMRRKNRIGDFAFDLKKLLDIDVFYYSMIDDSEKRTQLGVSAQEFQKVIPVLVSEQNNYLGVDYGKAGAVIAIRLVQDLLPWKDSVNSWMKEKDRQITELQNAVYAA